MSAFYEEPEPEEMLVRLGRSGPLADWPAIREDRRRSLEIFEDRMVGVMVGVRPPLLEPALEDGDAVVSSPAGDVPSIVEGRFDLLGWHEEDVWSGNLRDRLRELDAMGARLEDPPESRRGSKMGYYQVHLRWYRRPTPAEVEAAEQQRSARWAARAAVTRDRRDRAVVHLCRARLQIGWSAYFSIFTSRTSAELAIAALGAQPFEAMARIFRHVNGRPAPGSLKTARLRKKQRRFLVRWYGRGGRTAVLLVAMPVPALMLTGGQG